MTDRYEKIRKMSTHDIELPQGYAERPFDYSGDLYVEGQMRDYADAHVEHRTATLQAEIEALRAEVELWRHKAATHKYHRKKLAEALRDARRALAFASQHLPECNDPYERANRALAQEDSNG